VTLATQRVAGENGHVTAFRNLLLFAWFVSTQNIVRAHKTLKDDSAMMYIPKFLLMFFQLFHI